ncbi:MAG: hypothetical protein ACE5H3_09445, partial [Planctomycetota bacterium]
LYGTPLHLEGSNLVAGPPRLLTSPSLKTALFPRLARDGKGNPALVFQGFEHESFDVFFARGEERDGTLEWEAPSALWKTPSDEWCPRISADPAGGFQIVWDAFVDGNYRVLWGRVARNHPGERFLLDLRPGYQGFPDIAVDAAGTAWIAFETSPRFGEWGPLREARDIRLMRLQNGKTREMPLPPLSAGDPSRELPRLALDSKGLLLTWRELMPVGPLPEHPQFPNLEKTLSSWKTRACFFRPGGRIEAWILPHTEGDNDTAQALIPGEDGVFHGVSATDDRSRSFPDEFSWFQPIEGRWRLRLFDLINPGSDPERFLAGPEAGLSAAEDESGTPSPSPSSSGGRLFLGDLHRHTQISRCNGSSDGTILDAYRYAFGPGRLDFLAITDHFQHMTEWAWWRSLREAERFDIPGRMAAFVAVERMIVGVGHQNLIYVGAKPERLIQKKWMRPADGRLALDPKATLTIPHMMGRKKNPFLWGDFDPRFNRVFEVYQGARGSYEGPGLPYQSAELDPEGVSIPEALAEGRQFGLVASSDHNSSSTAFAGVFASGLTRPDIFRALRARHCFAATSRSRLEVSFGPLQAGDSGKPAASDSLVIRASRLPGRGEADRIPVAYAEVVKNGQVWRRKDGRGSGKETAEWFVLTTRARDPQSRLAVHLEGGRIGKFLPRIGGLMGAHLAGRTDRSFTVSGGTTSADFSFEVVPEPGAGGSTLTLSRKDRSEKIVLDDVPLGGSVRIGNGNPTPEWLWRMGPSLGTPALDWHLSDPDRKPGDSFYVRVAWEDGNLAWSSPIRIAGGTAAGPEK